MFTQNDKPETIEPIELHWAIRRSLLHPSLLPKTRPKKKCGERSPSGKTSTERNGSSQVLEGKNETERSVLKRKEHRISGSLFKEANEYGFSSCIWLGVLASTLVTFLRFPSFRAT